MTDQNWKQEQIRVNQVIHEIDRRLKQYEADVHVLQSDVVEMRKTFWDDVTVNLDDPHEAAETYASVKQQAEILSERERTHVHTQNQLRTLTRLRESPYFGRIDFVDYALQKKEAERIYIGLASLLTQTDDELLIYDWRAPIASLYYDYPPGEAQYDTPDGIVVGSLELKRQFIIKNGTIEGLFDTGVTIGDELLQEVLGKQGTNQMKTIVSTIQREQNQIIRNEKSQLLVVQGAAGSGKTSAALQRIAYLLYRYRDRLCADQIVLFSPNQMFNSYISTVLPELGEENMQQTTFQDYLSKHIGKAFTIEDPFSQLEYVQTASKESDYQARVEAIRFKATSDFIQLIECYVHQLGKQGLMFHNISFQGNVLITQKQIADKFYSFDPSISIPLRIKQLADWLLAQLKLAARKEQTKSWVEDELELLDKDDFQKAYDILVKQNRLRGNSFDDHEQEKKILGRMIVNKHFKPLRARIKRLGFLNLPSIYQQLFTTALDTESDTITLPNQWEKICSLTLEKLSHRELYYEDATPYLYLQGLLKGFGINTRVLHVFLDEAQDYSPFQLAFFKKMFPFSKMTLLGDYNQMILAHTASSHEWTAFTSTFSTANSEIIQLTRSYRSTRQIVLFTRELVEGGRDIIPFNRDGRKPTLTIAGNITTLTCGITKRLQGLQQAGHRTIAVICKTMKESKEAYELLRAELCVRLVEQDTASFEPGVLVVPASLSKGVEFDAVLIYNASADQYGKESDRKLLYTACTRAMHELHLYCLQNISPFISSVSSETYELHQE
ncbi:RNA polymerase recycling motor HelD [Brevibacillus laterosporus]|uniref:Helicase n=1 Tax=Brevibacillus laterosporus TaxID=1465 RepID=A0A0F7EJH7_BRELA|nr:RNA polymerase recycling motor HelD [Brevibacillus laterosporus]AKF96128.1 helicase [Brevibacillus laterosporus]